MWVRSLPTTADRLSNFEKYANDIKLTYEIIYGINGHQYIPIETPWLKHIQHEYPNNSYLGVLGNHISSIYLTLLAMQRGLNSVMICDDDTEFHHTKINEDISMVLPNDWDIIIFNSFNQNFDLVREQPLFFYKPHTRRELQGSNCIAINKKAYYTLLYYQLLIQYPGDQLYYLMLLNDVKIYKMLPEISLQNRLFPNTYRENYDSTDLPASPGWVNFRI